jgi:hypothetical protein
MPKIDEFVKNQRGGVPVIPANPGSGPGQAPESSYFKYLKILWTPVFTGVTTFYKIVKVDEIVKSPQIRFSVIPVETGIQFFQ